MAMATFGFTPIDAMCAAWGLHGAQQFFEILFHQTKMGYLILVVGGLILLMKSVPQARWGRFILYIFAAVVFTVLLNIPLAQDITGKSFQEMKGYEVSRVQDMAPSSAPMRMPLILVYANSFLNSLFFAFIETSNSFLPASLDFIKKPFNLQLVALSNTQSLAHGLGDPRLDRKLHRFLDDQFYPAQVILGKAVLPYDPEMESLFSPQGQQQWKLLKDEIAAFIEQDMSWKQTMYLLNAVNASPSQNYPKQIQDALIAQAVFPVEHGRLQQTASVVYRSWDFFVGGMHAVILSLFTPVIFLSLVMQKSQMLEIWVRALLWAKLLWVMAFVSYGCSLVMVKAQDIENGSALWCLGKPSFALAGAVLLAISVVLSVFLVWPFNKCR